MSEVESGGRMIDAILTHSVLPGISREYLSRLASGSPLTGISLSAAQDEFAFDFSASGV